MNVWNTGIAFVALAALSGCGGGGGGGGGASNAQPPSFAGPYEGNTASGKALRALFLEDGSYWVMYGLWGGGSLAVQGIQSGGVHGNLGGYTNSFTDFPAPGTASIAGSGTGSCTSQTDAAGNVSWNCNGSQTENGATSTYFMFTGWNTGAGPHYVYNTAANLTAVSGAWSGSLLDGSTATINILASGTFSGTSSLGCAVTGTIAPRPSGMNVFNVSLTFGAAPCALPNQTASGVAVAFPLSNGTTQFVSELSMPGNTLGISFSAVR